MSLNWMAFYHFISSSTLFLFSYHLWYTHVIVCKKGERKNYTFSANLKPCIVVPILERVTRPGKIQISGFIFQSKIGQSSVLSYRKLHQRKQNYEIYKFLKFQLHSKTKEVKKLKEHERKLQKNKMDVRNL